MADIEIPKIQPDDIFNIRLDTQERLSKLLNGVSSPTISPISTPSINNVADKSVVSKTIPDGLFSDNYATRVQAAQLYEQQMQKNPAYTLNVGYEISTPYDQTKKYINKDFGFDARANNEDVYWNSYNRYFNKHPILGSIGNVGKFVGRIAIPAITKTVQGFGYIVGGLWNLGQEAYEKVDNQFGGDFKNNFWVDFADNQLAKAIENFEQDVVKDKWMPVYRSLNYDKKGTFGKLFDPTFWNESVADGFAFLGSVLIPGMAASKLGLLGKVGAASEGLFGSANVVQKGLSGAARVLTGASNKAELSMWAYNTAIESAFEASGVFKNTFEQLKELKASGDPRYANKNEEELKLMAGEKAANTFSSNAAILMFSNAWEQKNILNPLLGKYAKTGKQKFNISNTLEAVSNIKSPSSIGGKIWDWSKFWGAKAISATAAEGFWEENIQLAIERINTPGNEHDYSNLSDPYIKRLFSQYKTQTQKALEGEDSEVSESILLGGIIGTFGTGVSNFNERKNRFKLDPISQEKIADINNARSNYLDYNQLISDDKLNIEKAQVVLNKLAQLSDVQLKIDDLKTPAIRQQLKDVQLGDYVRAIVNAGKFGDFTSRITDLNSATAEQLNSFGFDATDFAQSPNSFLSKANDFKNLYDRVFNSDITSDNPILDLDRKNLAYEKFVIAIATNNLKNQNSPLITQLKENIVKNNINNSTEIIEYISNKLLIEKTREYLKDESVPEFIKKEKQERLKNIERKNKEYEEYYLNLRNKKEKTLLEEVAKIEANEKQIEEAIYTNNYIGELLLSEEGNEAYEQLFSIRDKNIKKADKENEKFSSTSEKQEEVDGNIKVVFDDSKTSTDTQFISSLNTALKPTTLKAEFTNGKYKLKIENSNTKNVFDTREELINEIKKELQNINNYKEIDAKSLDVFENTTQGEIEKDNLKHLEKIGRESSKKDVAIIPFTDSRPKFEERFAKGSAMFIYNENSEIIEIPDFFHRQEYMFKNFINGEKEFTGKENLVVIPLTNINISKVESALQIKGLDFLISNDPRYIFRENQDNSEAIIWYLYAKKENDKITLINKEGNAVTDLKSELVATKAVSRNIDSLISNGKLRNNQLQYKEALNDVLIKFTNYFSTQNLFEVLPFEISGGLQNAEIKKDPINHISYEDNDKLSPVDNLIKSKDINKTALIETPKQTLVTSTGQLMIAGRTYLTIQENNNTGSPFYRHVYLDNRPLSSEELSTASSVFKNLLLNFLNTNKLSLNSEEYRYLSGLFRLSNKMNTSAINIWTKEDKLFVQIGGKNSIEVVSEDKIEDLVKNFSAYTTNLLHRVEYSLIKDKKEFYDFNKDKTYPSYSHYLLNNVLTYRHKDRTQNKPENEEDFNFIQRYAIVDIAEKMGLSTKDIINKKSESKPLVQKEKVFVPITIYYNPRTPDIKQPANPITQTETKNEKPLTAAFLKNLSNILDDNEKPTQELKKEETKEEKQDDRPLIKSFLKNLSNAIENESEPSRPKETPSKLDDEISSEEQLQKDRLNKLLDDDDENFRLSNDIVNNTEEVDPISGWEISEVKRMLKNIELISSDKTRIYGDRYVWGSFKNSVITLYSNAPKGTGFHEAFEAVFNGVLSNIQQQNLYDNFLKRPGVFTTFLGEVKHFSEATFREAKEKMSDEFHDYKNNMLASDLAPETFFEKLWQFIKEFFNSILINAGLIRFSKFNQLNLYRSMDSGLFSNFEFDTPTSEYFSLSIHNEKIRSFETHQFVMSANTIMFDILKEKNPSLLNLIESNDNLSENLYKELRERFRDYYFNDEKFKPFLKSRRQILKQIYPHLDKNGINDILVKEMARSSVYLKELVNENDDTVWREFVQLHKNYLRQFGLTTTEEQEKNKSDESTNEYNNDKLKFDNFKSIPSTIKLLIASLPEKIHLNGVETLVINESTYLPNSINSFRYIKLFNKLMSNLAGSTSIESVYNKLKTLLKEDLLKGSSEEQKFYYSVNDLKQLLFKETELGEIDYSSYSTVELSNLLRFVSAFSKQMPEHIHSSISEENDDLFLRNSNLNTIAHYTEMNFYNELRNRLFNKKSAKYPSYISGPAKGKFYIRGQVIGEPPAIGKLSISELAEFSTYLNKFGFNYFTAERLNLMSEDDIRSIWNNVNIIQEYWKGVNGFGIEIKKIDTTNIKESTRIKRISEIIAKYEINEENPQLFNIEGEAINKVIDHNFFSILRGDILSSSTYEEFIEKNPQFKSFYAQNSIILNRIKKYFDLKETSTDAEKLIPINAIFQGSDASGKGIQASNLVGSSLYLSRFVLSMGDSGIKPTYPIYENADGNIDWEITLNDYYLSKEAFSSDRQLTQLLKNYLKDEILAAINYNLNGTKTINTEKEIIFTGIEGKETKLNRYGSSLFFTTEFLSADEIDTIHNFINSQNSIDIDTVDAFISNVENLSDSFRELIKNRTEEHFNFLERESLIETKDGKMRIKTISKEIQDEFINANTTINGGIKDLLAFKIANDYFSSVENSKFIYGRLSSFKTPSDFLKRTKNFLSPRLITLDSPELNSRLNEVLNEDLKKDDLTYHDHKSSLEFWAIDDIKTVNESLQSIDKYQKIESTDSFSMATLSLIRELDYKSGGRFTPQQEYAYQVFNAYERLMFHKNNIQKYTSNILQEKDEKLLKPFLQNEEYFIELPVPITTKKPIFSSVNAEGETVLIKTSTMPLTYYTVKDTMLEDIYISMKKKRVDLLAFNSALKSGGIKNDVKIINTDGKLNSIEEFPIQSLKKKDAFIQTETEGEKDASTAGTQTMVVITQDIYSNGVPRDFKGDNWSELSEKDRLDNSPLYKKDVNHREKLTNLFNSHYFDFLSSIGAKELYNEDGSFKGYSIKSFKKFRDKIFEYVTKHGVTQNVLEQLQYNENEDVGVAYELTTDYELIRNIIYSIIDKSIASPKLHGGQKIQFPHIFFNNKNSPYSLVYKKDGVWIKANSQEEIGSAPYFIADNGLEFYKKNDNGTLRMQVKVSSRILRDTNRKRKDLGLTPLSEKEFLSFLKTNSPKLLEGIGFRIPTQALNTIEAFEIVGFLPDFMGDVISVPAEIVAKVGSDFDVDKITTYLNNYYLDDKGIPRYIEYKTEFTEKELLENYEKRFLPTTALLRYIEREERRLQISQTPGVSKDGANTINKLIDNIFDLDITHVIQEVIDKKMTLPELLQKAIQEEEDAFISFEEFKNLPVYLQNSKTAVENAYFQSIADILLDSNNFENLIRPNDASEFSSRNEDGLITKLNNLKKIVPEKSSSINVSKLTDSLKLINARTQFSLSKKLVGIAAIGVISNINFQRFNSVVIPSTYKNLNIQKNKLRFPHNKFNELSTFSSATAIDKESISKRTGSKVDGTVDAVKDNWLSDLGITGNAFSPSIVADRLGYNPYHIILISNSPLVKKYLEIKDIWNSPAYAIDTELKNLYPKIYNSIDWLIYFTNKAPVSFNNYNEKVDYEEIKDTGDIEKLIKNSHLNGQFNYQEFIKNTTYEEYFTALNVLEEFLNLENLSNELRSITSSSNHHTAHIKDTYVTAIKEQNLLLADSYSIKEWKDNNLFNAGEAIRNSTFIGELANKILRFENNFIYANNGILMPQTKEIIKYVIKEQSLDATREVFESRVEPASKDMIRAALSSFIFDSKSKISNDIRLSDLLKNIIHINSDIKEAFEIAKNLVKNKITEFEKYKSGDIILENLEIVPEANSDFYYLRVLKRPMSADIIGSEIIYESLKNLKYNQNKIPNTNFTYSDLYKFIMLHSIARNGMGFSRNSLLSFMDKEEYLSISKDILNMELSEQFFANIGLIRLQNDRYKQYARHDNYLKGPFFVMKVKDGKITTNDEGKYLSLYGSDYVSTYLLNTHTIENEKRQFEDLILLPEQTNYKNVASKNHQVKRKYMFLSTGSNKKGNKTTQLLKNSGITVSINKNIYHVYQQIPLKGTKFSVEYQGIKNTQDIQSNYTDDITPYYTQEKLIDLFDSLKEFVSLETKVNTEQDLIFNELMEEKRNETSKDIIIEDPNSDLTIGQSVTYKGEEYVITKINKNNTIQIFKEGSAKKSVARRNLIINTDIIDNVKEEILDINSILNEDQYNEEINNLPDIDIDCNIN